MFNIVRKEVEWGGRTLVLETGRIARQADGAVLVTYGETTVLCTAVAQKTPRAGIDFFPLTVNYQEKTFAAGKIPGGFFKREGRPAEKETLTSRAGSNCAVARIVRVHLGAVIIRIFVMHLQSGLGRDMQLALDRWLQTELATVSNGIETECDAPQGLGPHRR